MGRKQVSSLLLVLSCSHDQVGLTVVGDTQLNIEVLLHLLFKGVKRWREGGGMPRCGVDNKVRMHTHTWKTPVGT